MNLKKTHPSNSDVQLLVEQSVSSNYATANKLEPANIAFKQLGLVIKPDGVFKDANGSIYVLEIFAHTGKLNAGQKKKIATDVLKLAYVKSKHLEYRVQILFVNKTCFESAQSGWVYEASKHFGIEMLYVALPPELKKKLKDAQYKQSDAQAVSSKEAQT